MTILDDHPAKMDHFPIVTTLYMSMVSQVETPSYNFKGTDWEAVREELVTRLARLECKDVIPTEGKFFTSLNALTCAIEDSIHKKVSLVTPAPYQKCWWSRELSDRCREVRRLARRSHDQRTESEDPVYQAHKTMRRGYTFMIENAKTTHWDGFLSTLDEKSVWTVHKYASRNPTDGGRSHILTLKLATGKASSQIVKMNEEKSKLLHTTFFPNHAQSDQPQLDSKYPPPKFGYSPVTDEQIHQAITRLSPHKAPGPDGIPNVFLIHCTDLIVPHLGPLF